MKRNLVGVIAVSMAALLFAGCGGGSGLSPAQKERCEGLERGITALKKSLPDLEIEFQIKGMEKLTEWNKERADRGC